MPAVQRFEDLEIWQLARRQAMEVSQFPLNFYPDLLRQIQRSSVSVMDNIAEGFARGGRKEFKNFLIIAKGSNAEVKSQLYRISDLELAPKINVEGLINKNDVLGRRIFALINYLKKSDNSGTNY